MGGGFSNSHAGWSGRLGGFSCSPVALIMDVGLASMVVLLPALVALVAVCISGPFLLFNLSRKGKYHA